MARLDNEVELELYDCDYAMYYRNWLTHGHNVAVSDKRFIYDLTISPKRHHAFMEAWGGCKWYYFLIPGPVTPTDFLSLQMFRIEEIQNKK